ncbi:MAG: hypothetical protein QM765_46630 [Myxococcales bacterium]
MFDPAVTTTRRPPPTASPPTVTPLSAASFARSAASKLVDAEREAVLVDPRVGRRGLRDRVGDLRRRRVVHHALPEGDRPRVPADHLADNRDHRDLDVQDALGDRGHGQKG